MDDAQLREALAGYVDRLFAPEDDVLRELRAEIRRRGMPEIAISAAEGKLLQVLLAAIGASAVLEIGTLGGYSAIWMARALPPDGRLVTLEREPEHAAVAREFVARAGLQEVVEVVDGDAARLLPELEAQAAGSFDACFIDADKEGYPAYLAAAQRLVRPGGLILGDNAFWSGHILDDSRRDTATEAMRAFNQRLATDPAFVSTIIPIRDGLAVAVVR